MNRYEEKKQARIDYYREKSLSASVRSNELCNESSKMISAIPFGQPILVGHHSEQGDRNYRNRANNKMQKSVDESNKADYYDQKALAAENNKAISSDDPEAITKLSKKLALLQAHQEEMKAANKHYKKHKTMRGYKELSDHDADKIDKKISEDYSFHQCPYPSYKLQNNNANMKQVKNRLAALERRDKLVEASNGWEFDGGKVVFNSEENRIQVIFDEKPNEEIRKELKSRGFNWSRYHMAWQRQLNANGIWASKQIKCIQPNNECDD